MLMQRATAFPYEIYDRWDETYAPGMGIDFIYLGSWLLSNGYTVGSLFNADVLTENLEAVLNGPDPSTLDVSFTLGDPVSM